MTGSPVPILLPEGVVVVDAPPPRRRSARISANAPAGWEAPSCSAASGLASDNHTFDGDPDTGAALVERVLRTGNDLGLLAEQAGPGTDRPLGNFPQGLTHMGVIQSAHRLDTAGCMRRPLCLDGDDVG